MILESVNLLAVILATVASIVIGFVWYGPLFGKAWAKEMGWSEAEMEKKKKEGNMGKSYGMMTVGSLVGAYILAQFVTSTNSIGAWEGAMVGFWAWLGFAAPIMMGSVLWEGKSWKLYQINVGYQLVTWFIMGAILGNWM